MGNGKLTFEDFIVTVDNEYRDFVNDLHHTLISCGCVLEVKEAKSGYLASYQHNKKAVANYVFRKKGLIVRIYANHLGSYMKFLDTLPDGMLQTIKAAPVCKRLINPDACNSKCAMGYDFLICEEHLQKCRNNAFMFLVCEDYNPFIKTFLENEIEACS